jgi:FkbM family methyltransferase
MLCNRFVRVISFEPGLEAYRILCRRFHEFTGIDIRNEALLDYEQQVEVKQPPGRLKLSSRYVDPAKDGPVRAISLDMLRLPSCGLLKLDLEGAEYPALIGARRTIRKHRPVLIVELNSLGLRFGHADRGTLNLIEGMGYKAVYHSSPDTVFVHAG